MLFRLLLICYAVALLVLSLVSLNRYVLVSICRKFAHRRREALPPVTDGDAPLVTIQLPIYNEYYVAERLIRSACEVDYPSHRLEVQVLDDSTDDTLALTRELVRDWRRRNINITHLHRENRTGFKGGALAYGLERAHGEFVAVFDADFVIPRDFLRRTIPFFHTPDTGIVQTRWTYLNDSYSALTRATVIGLDAEFGIEQPGRYWGGMFLGFNGTGAVLRTECIRQAGGWQDDTITEDLDLSYRAQLAGWSIRYLSDVTCPSEVPADVHGLKAQQFRWTKGTQETARKLLPHLWRSSNSFWVKLQGTLHLLANSTYPFLLLIGILNPLMVYSAHSHHIQLAWPLSVYFLFSTFGTYSYHAEAVRALHRDWLRRMVYFPMFLGQAIGLSVINSKAALEAWLGHKSPFLRTPKYDLTKRGQRWGGLRYRSKFSWSAAIEICLGLYTAAAIWYAIDTGEYGAIPFLALFAFGYLLLGYYSVHHRFLLRGATRPMQAADMVHNVAVTLLIALLCLGTIHCGASGLNTTESATARDGLSAADVPLRPPPGFAAVSLVSTGPASASGTRTGEVFYQPKGDHFEWFVNAQGFTPGSHYRVELNVDDSLNYAIGSIAANSQGQLLGFGVLSRFADRYCVGANGSPPAPLTGPHWIGIRIKEDGSTPGDHSITGSSLPCTGNGDGHFEYMMYEQRIVPFDGMGNTP